MGALPWGGCSQSTSTGQPTADNHPARGEPPAGIPGHIQALACYYIGLSLFGRRSRRGWIDLPAGPVYVGMRDSVAGIERLAYVLQVHGVVAIKQLEIPGQVFIAEPGMIPVAGQVALLQCLGEFDRISPRLAQLCD